MKARRTPGKGAAKLRWGIRLMLVLGLVVVAVLLWRGTPGAGGEPDEGWDVRFTVEVASPEALENGVEERVEEYLRSLEVVGGTPSRGESLRVRGRLRHGASCVDWLAICRGGKVVELRRLPPAPRSGVRHP